MKNRAPAFVILVLAATLQACAMFGGGKSDRGDAADRALAAGDTTKAIQLLERDVKGRDAPPQRYAQLAGLYRSRGAITDRLAAQYLLEDGLRRYPDDPDILHALGLTYYAQTFYADAEGCFLKVIRMQPDNCEARYYVALNAYRKWKHIQVATTLLVQSQWSFELTIRCDPLNEDAYFKYAFVTYMLGDRPSTARLVDDMRVYHPASARAAFLAGAVAYDAGRYELAEALLDSGLVLLPEDDERAYRDISWLIMDEGEREFYEEAAQRKQRNMERVYWAERDPDPTTSVNEARSEHLYRKFLADTRYNHHWPVLRGWETERGRALIKFGQPVAIGSTLEGRSNEGRMEMWTYAFADTAFALFFRDEFLNGNYMVPFGPLYSRYAQALYLDPPKTNYESPFVDIPGDVSVVAFRNDSYADVYVSARIDRDSIAATIIPDMIDGYVARTSFFDMTWHSQSFFADTTASDRFWRAGRPNDRWYYLVRSYQQPFDYHRVAVSFGDNLELTQSLLRAEASTVGYFTDSLLVSDILLHHGPVAQSAWDGAIIERKGQRMVPNPAGEYGDVDKLWLYVEVYNLRVQRSQSDYEVTYSIFENSVSAGTMKQIGRGLKKLMGFNSPPKPVISQTLIRRGADHEAWEDLAIDIDALKPGRYTLSIEVTDTISHEAAKSTRIFVKVPMKVAER